MIQEVFVDHSECMDDSLHVCFRIIVIPAAQGIVLILLLFIWILHGLLDESVDVDLHGVLLCSRPVIDRAEASIHECSVLMDFAHTHDFSLVLSREGLDHLRRDIDHVSLEGLGHEFQLNFV